MPHPVADMLIIARSAYIEALASGDNAALGRAVELAVKVIAHPRAGKFFNALTAAIKNEIEDAEMLGNDPEVLNNGDDPLDPNSEVDDLTPDVDEDSDASNPADEGLVDHDHEEDQEEDPSEPQENTQLTPVNASCSGIARNVTETRRAVSGVMANLARFR